MYDNVFIYLSKLSRLVILDNHLHSRRIVYRHEHTSGRILIKKKEYVNKCMAFRKHIYLQYPIARIIYSASGLDIYNCSNHFRTHTHSHLGLPVSCNELIICGHTIWRRILLSTTLYARDTIF